MNMNLVSKFLGSSEKNVIPKEDDSYLKEMLFHLFWREIVIIKREDEIMRVFQNAEVFPDQFDRICVCDIAIGLVFQREFNYFEDHLMAMFHEVIFKYVMEYDPDVTLNDEEKSEFIKKLAKKLSCFLYEGGREVRECAGGEGEQLKIFFNHYYKYFGDDKLVKFQEYYKDYLRPEVVGN